MAGREHCGGQTVPPTREVGLVGRAEPQHDDGGTPCLRAAGEGSGETGRAVAHVVADGNLEFFDASVLGRHLIGEGGAQRLDDRIGELTADEPAHVVGLDERGEVGCGGHASTVPGAASGQPTSPSAL